MTKYRPLSQAKIGDVLTDANGMWMVDDVELGSGKDAGMIRLKVRAGRTDSGHWTPWHPTAMSAQLYTPEVRS